MRFRRMLCALLLAALLVGAALPARALESGKLMKVSTKANWVALRSDASTKARRLAKLTNGTLAIYEGRAKNGFLLVRVGDQLGYVAKGGLKVQNRALKTREEVWLRSKAGGDGGEKLRKLKKGATVVALNDAGGAWYHVAYNGLEGYLKSSDLCPASVSDGQRICPIMKGGKKTIMRKSPSSGARKVGSIPRYAIAVSFGLVGGSEWEYVYYKGKYGFIRPDFCDDWIY